MTCHQLARGIICARVWVAEASRDAAYDTHLDAFVQWLEEYEAMFARLPGPERETARAILDTVLQQLTLADGARKECDRLVAAYNAAVKNAAQV